MRIIFLYFDTTFYFYNINTKNSYIKDVIFYLILNVYLKKVDAYFNSKIKCRKLLLNQVILFLLKIHFRETFCIGLRLYNKSY